VSARAWHLPPGDLVCSFLGCDEPVATWVVPPYQQGSGWCSAHVRRVIDAATIGYATGTSCEHKPIDEVRKMRVNQSTRNR
jgi:hypothetical protein